MSELKTPSFLPNVGFIERSFLEDIVAHINQAENQNAKLEKRIAELEQKISKTKECPLCSEEINENAAFCRFCGGNVLEYEIAEKKRKQQVLEEQGLNALLSNEEVKKGADLTRRMYGKSAYVSYLKDKAKELGYGNIELTEDDVE